MFWLLSNHQLFIHYFIFFPCSIIDKSFCNAITKKKPKKKTIQTVWLERILQKAQLRVLFSEFLCQEPNEIWNVNFVNVKLFLKAAATRFRVIKKLSQV